MTGLVARASERKYGDMAKANNLRCEDIISKKLAS